MKAKAYNKDRFYLYVLRPGRIKHAFYACYSTERHARLAVEKVKHLVVSYSIIKKIKD
jgi:hypothetical protein